MYKFHTKPYRHQKVALLYALKKGSAGFLMKPGCGKTKPSIDYIGCRHIMGQADRILVVAPKTVLGVWEDEIQTHLPPSIERTVVRLEGSTRVKKLDKYKNTKGLIIYLISYDSAWRTSKPLLKMKPDMVICDESHYLANPNSKRSKFAHKIRKQAKWRLILTGTFLPNGVLGAYSQIVFVNPDAFNGIKYGQYKDRFGIWYRPKGEYYKIFKRPKRTKELNKIVAKNCVIVNKEEALDLPEQRDVIVPVDMSPKGWKHYRQMKKDKLIRFKQGKARANIILTELLHFQQITGGFIRVDTGKFDHNDKPIREDVFLHADKLKAVSELIDIHREHGEKVIIFCQYIWEYDRIAELLAKKKVSFAGIKGAVKNRDEIRRDFQKGKYEVLIAQIATGGIGITLTAANIVIFYSRNQRLDHYEQARDRVHRPGQERDVTYYHLVVKGTIDEAIMKSHLEKQSLQDMITSKNWEAFI